MSALDSARAALALFDDPELGGIIWADDVASALRALISEHDHVTAPPTDDEREVLAEVARDLDDRGDMGKPWSEDYALADAILAAGFRRRGPVTDAEVEASGRVMYEKDAAIHRWAAPWAKLASSTRSRYYHVARAALEAAREVQS